MIGHSVLGKIIHVRKVVSSSQMRATLLDIRKQYMKVYNINSNNVTIKHRGKILSPSIILQYIWGYTIHVRNVISSSYTRPTLLDI